MLHKKGRSSLTVIPRRVTVGIPQTEIEISKTKFYDGPLYVAMKTKILPLGTSDNV